MFFKVSILIVAICVQANLVFSQQQQQQQPQGFGNQGSQSWDPYSWAAPYYAAANTAWNDYIQKSQQASNQLYKQWDKTGAGDMMNTGMAYAQQAAAQGQKIAEEAMKQAMKYAMMG